MKHESKLNEILQLNFEGKTIKEINSITNVPITTIKRYIRKFNKEINFTKSINDYSKTIKLTDFQLQVLYGSLLGDMSISLTKHASRPAISLGGHQELYFDYKCEIFSNLIGKINKTPRFDSRTNKYYNKYFVRFLANKYYNNVYNELYIDGVKTITPEYLNKLTPVSLAFWFMDDGCNSGVLATNCFTKDECILIQTCFKNKFNIETTITSSNGQHLIYIKKKSRKNFATLVKPYFIPSMEYKIENWIP